MITSKRQKQEEKIRNMNQIKQSINEELEGQQVARFKSPHQQPQNHNQKNSSKNTASNNKSSSKGSHLHSTKQKKEENDKQLQQILYQQQQYQ